MARRIRAREALRLRASGLSQNVIARRGAYVQAQRQGGARRGRGLEPDMRQREGHDGL